MSVWSIDSKTASAVRAAAMVSLCVTMVSIVHARTDALKLVEQTLSVNGERQTVRVPEGYRLELLTDKLDGPRLLTFANGELLVGSKSGKIYRLTPPYTQPEVLVTLDGYPHSIAVRGNELLIAKTDGLYHAFYKAGQARILPQDVKLLAPLPSSGKHSSRSVAIGPDGRVYLSLGISGNCSDQYIGDIGDNYPFEARRGGVMVLREDVKPTRWEAYATGLRNPIGFDWRPKTHELYASNNGPDHLGYDQPPEYFSHLTAGSFHGMPWFQYNGESIQRDECIKRVPPRPIGDVVPPVATFPARSAPMGVAFVPAGAMDERLEFDAVVAVHGSWATQPNGGFLGDAATRRPPKIVAVRFDGATAKRVDDLVTGFQLPNGKRWARPVGVAVGPDGALYFTSDSGAEALFRLKRVQ